MQRDGYGIEVICTGDEILFGRVTDTNSNWIARRSTELGARLRRITCVGDDIEEISNALQSALTRDNSLILFTGGLGPSEDDLTVEAIGKAVERNVILDQGAVQKIRKSYKERGIQSTPRGERMARVIEGSKALINPVGMATGMALPLGSTIIMTFPGVPSEMKAMFEAYAVPLIKKRASSKFVAKTVVAKVVFKDFFPVYREMQRDYPEAYIKNAATPPEAPEERLKVKEIKVDIVVKGSSLEESKTCMEKVLVDFHMRLQKVGGEILSD